MPRGASGNQAAATALTVRGIAAYAAAMGWHRARSWLFIGALAYAATGCGNGKTSPAATGGSTGTAEGGGATAAIDGSPGAGAIVASAAAGEWACASCVISCDSPSDCCGEACQCELPYHRDQQQAIREANTKHCAIKDYECPQYDCDKPTDDVVAVCIDAVCSAKRVPR